MISTDKLKWMLDASTGGPWRIRVNAGDDQDTCDLSICGSIFVLADMNGPQYPHQRPNAALIAAAPDLAVELIAARAKIAAADALADAHRNIAKQWPDSSAAKSSRAALAAYEAAQ